jgi:hypothetical protein
MPDMQKHALMDYEQDLQMSLCLLVMHTSYSFPNLVEPSHNALLFLQSFLFQKVLCIQSFNIGAFLFKFLILTLPLLFTDAFRCSNICRDILSHPEISNFRM